MFKKPKSEDTENLKAAMEATEEAVAADKENIKVTDSTSEVDNLVSEESKIEELEKQLEAEKNRNLLLQADFQNYRKRVAKELGAARIQGLHETVNPFIQVFDYFQLATKAAEDSDNIDAIRTGMNLIANEYQKALDELGISKINAIGETFNPEIHEAVAHEASELPEGKIIKEWNCGYRLGERLLRPSKVVVSSGNAPEQDGE